MEMLNFGDMSLRSLRSPDRRPCFYKIFWKNVLNNSSELQIPPDFFSDHLESEEAEAVTLKGPLGRWDATLEQRDDGVYMVRGWQDFVTSHCLGDKELALFLYNGGMSFDVIIFGKNGSPKTYQTSPHQELASAFPIFKHKMKGTNVFHKCTKVIPKAKFTSSFPFFEHKMTATNVGHKCTMAIPKAFSSKLHHLPKSKQMMLLRDSDGLSWLINIIVTSNGRHALCGGWKTFTDAHSIKEGHVCIFELLEPKLMQVHILR